MLTMVSVHLIYTWASQQGEKQKAVTMETKISNGIIKNSQHGKSNLTFLDAGKNIES